MTGPRHLLILLLLFLATWLLLWWLTDITRRGFDPDATPATVTDVSLAKPDHPLYATTTAPTTTTTARARTAPTVRAASVSRPTPTGDVWHALAMCETGGTMNQRATSRTGRYLGYFQFSLATWRSVGGPGDPRDHSYDVQKSYAVVLQARSGWGQWPYCSRKLGLR